jgi:hypothetical protein
MTALSTLIVTGFGANPFGTGAAHTQHAETRVTNMRRPRG